MPQQSPALALGMPFIELQSVDSTNNYAFEQVHAGLAHHGAAFFAWEQTAGKGQRGRSWTSQKEANIMISLVIRPYPLQVTQQFHLIACVAVAVNAFFLHYAGSETKIKWPNDLYWQDRKAGGILIESVISRDPNNLSPQWQWAIAGIGININQTLFSPGLLNPVSLKQITGKNFDCIKLAKELCSIIDLKFQLLRQEGFGKIHAEYLLNLYKLNKKVRLKKGNRNFEAIIRTVTPQGRLRVEHAVEEDIDFGEVEWVI